MLATVLALTSLVAIPGSLLYPEPAIGEIYTLRDLRPIRDFWWAWNTLLSANLVLNVPALALGGVLLTPGRGRRWGQVGGLLMWVGTAFYAAGAGGMGMAYYVATDPSLDDGTAAVMVASLNSDLRMYAAALAGSVLVAVGTTAQAVGLLRARTVPCWVPVLSLAILVTFFMPTNAGPVGLLVEVPITVAAVAIAWYLSRSAPTCSAQAERDLQGRAEPRLEAR